MSRGKGKRGDRGGDRGDSAWASVVWASDGRSFKIDQERAGIDDKNVDQWIVAVQRELDWTEGRGVACSSLNLSRNELTDAGVRQVMKFLIRMNVSVGMLKMFKNSIGDKGMEAIGEFIHKLHEPVQEIHLSHNQISSKGALSVFEAVKDCGRYPCSRGKDGTPLWLRMENNHIDWEPVMRQLEAWRMRWSIGDNRDSWKSKRDRNEADACPLVAMHYSYVHQTPQRAGHGGRGDAYEWNEGDDYGRGSSNSGRREEEQMSANGYGYSVSSASRRGGDAEVSGRKSRGADRHDSDEQSGNREEQEGTEVTAMRQYIDNQLQRFSDQQTKKFEIVFDILRELKEKTTELETCVQEITQAHQQHLMHQQMQHQPPQQYAVQMMQVPVDGGGQPQNWSADRRPGNVVW